MNVNKLLELNYFLILINIYDDLRAEKLTTCPIKAQKIVRDFKRKI